MEPRSGIDQCLVIAHWDRRMKRLPFYWEGGIVHLRARARKKTCLLEACTNGKGLEGGQAPSGGISDPRNDKDDPHSAGLEDLLCRILSG